MKQSKDFVPIGNLSWVIFRSYGPETGRGGQTKCPGVLKYKLSKQRKDLPSSQTLLYDKYPMGNVRKTQEGALLRRGFWSQFCTGGFLSNCYV